MLAAHRAPSKRPSRDTAPKKILIKKPAAVPTSARGGNMQSKKPAATPPKKRLRTKTSAAGTPCVSADVSVPLARVLYILRGPPGCGKSTAARELLAQHLRAQGINFDEARAVGGASAPFLRAFILSTDDYFTHIDASTGEAQYVFDPKALRKNHERNQERCEVAMRSGLTPLFVDNTNACLWEMRAYVHLADDFNYAVKVVDPGMFSTVASDVDILVERCERRGGGKDIARHVVERMVQHFEDVPRLAGGAESLDPLDAVRGALSPFERQESRAPKPARYVGLDVESRALAALGGIELGSLFWSDDGGKHHGVSGHYLDARGFEDGKGALSASGPTEGPFVLPARLHVTVRFFGARPDSECLAVASSLEGSWHSVSASELVFVRGGGLLCAACSVSSSSELQGLPQDGWIPHVTLLTRRGSAWRPVDSTSVLRALRTAEAGSGEAPHGPEVVSHGGVDTEVFRGLRVGEREHERAVDICVIRLRPAIELGPCRFVSFWA